VFSDGQLEHYHLGSQIKNLYEMDAASCNSTK
jgi:arginine decarboxylase-like protein